MLPLEKETIGDKTQPNFLALMTMEVTDPRDQLKSEVGAQDYLHEAGGGRSPYVGTFIFHIEA